MRIIAIVIVLALIGFGVAHFVRRNIRDTREQLKHVDRDNLKDLSEDDWRER